MPKKNQKMRKLVEEIEPFEPLERRAESTESGIAPSQDEAVQSESNPQDAEEPVEVSSGPVEATSQKADSAPDQDPAEVEASDPSASVEDESPEEDLLADVRQSLIEEESLEKEKPQKWWRKVGKGRKKDKVTKPVPEEELSLPVTEIPIGAIEEQEKTQESEEYLEQIDELRR